MTEAAETAAETVAVETVARMGAAEEAAETAAVVEDLVYLRDKHVGRPSLLIDMNQSMG